MKLNDRWPGYYFSLANPESRKHEGLPALLRRVADRIEAREITSEEILGVTIGRDSVLDDDSWTATVFFSPDLDGDSRS